MDKDELKALLVAKQVPSCCIANLGNALGHLFDHELNREQVLAVVDMITVGILKVKQNPAAMRDLLKGIEHAAKTAGL